MYCHWNAPPKKYKFCPDSRKVLGSFNTTFSLVFLHFLTISFSFRLLFRDLLFSKVGSGRSERNAQHQDAGWGECMGGQTKRHYEVKGRVGGTQKQNKDYGEK
jgi:hypothetical protein